MENTIIPEQTEGKQNDLKHTVSFEERKAAHACFKQACDRMRHPDRWHKLCGALSADFRVIGQDGLPARAQVKRGDYLQIDIPGPGTKAGNGYDWVRVDKLEDCPEPSGPQELCGMQLRPCTNPQKNPGNTAHFFMEHATSTFIIQRRGNEVTASYHGRNEQPNVNTGSKMDNVRNAVITSGAMAGLSELQWYTLIKAFIEDGK